MPLKGKNFFNKTEYLPAIIIKKKLSLYMLVLLQLPMDILTWLVMFPEILSIEVNHALFTEHYSQLSKAV